MDKSQIKIEPIERKDLCDYGSLNRLFGKCFLDAPHLHGHGNTNKYLEWLYQKNPLGIPVGFNAYANNTIIGHYATIPIKWRFEGLEYDCLLSLNTAVDPDYQGYGLFTRLARNTYELAASRNYRFVYGVANDASTPGFVRKLGFTHVGALNAQVFFPFLWRKARVEKIRKYECEQAFTQAQIEWRLNRPGSRYVHSNDCIVAFNKSVPLPIVSFRQDFGLDSIEMEGLPNLALHIGTSRIRGGIDVPKFFRRSPLNLIHLDLAKDDGQSAEFIFNDTKIDLFDFDLF